MKNARIKDIEGEDMKKLLISKKEFFLILLGVTILALGVNWFTSPLGLVTGGISGITIIVKHISNTYLGFEIPLWITKLDKTTAYKDFLANLKPLCLILIINRGKFNTRFVIHSGISKPR